MSDKRIYELPSASTLNPGDKLAIDKNGFTEAKSIDASIILDKFTDLTNNKANQSDLISLANNKASKSNLTNISITGSTNNTGSTITSGSFFYKDGTLVRAKTDIANNATLTLNTNYEIVTAGGLNELNNAFSDITKNFTQIVSNAQPSNIDVSGYTELLFGYADSATQTWNMILIHKSMFVNNAVFVSGLSTTIVSRLDFTSATTCKISSHNGNLWAR